MWEKCSHIRIFEGIYNPTVERSVTTEFSQWEHICLIYAIHPIVSPWSLLGINDPKNVIFYANYFLKPPSENEASTFSDIKQII